ncbi:MAG: aminopeptidase P family protein [Micrococcaceae bacterium]
MSNAKLAPLTDPQKARVNNRSRKPESKEFERFISEDWDEKKSPHDKPFPVAKYTAKRREQLSQHFSGDRLILPAGDLKVRSNDTDYMYRPHSAFAHYVGSGAETEPGSVLVLEPEKKGHKATLYVYPASPYGSEESYNNSRNGAFWVGMRPSLEETQKHYLIDVKDIKDLEKQLAQKIDGSVRIVREADPAIEATLQKYRKNMSDTQQDQADFLLAEVCAEQRLVKDQYAIDEMKKATQATAEGFENIVRKLPQAVKNQRGERVVETSFYDVARVQGYHTGYETIAASGNDATTLHWNKNTGDVKNGDVLLVDAGVELESLYTADVTRSMPISGKFTDVQRKVYTAVLDAADAGFKVAVPGNKFRDVHNAAIKVIAERLEEWGILPCTAEESLQADKQFHRRWMIHGTSHHLGLDVHDCAEARKEMYLDAELVPGMIFTIEPGLYFKENDLKVPEEYRGIGVRIEDDVLVTEKGNENLSAMLPRKADDVEAWMQSILKK